MKMKFATLAAACAFVLGAGPALADHSPDHGKGQIAFEIPYDAATPAEAPKAAPGTLGKAYHYRNCWNYYRWYYSYYYGWQRYYVGTRCYY